MDSSVLALDGYLPVQATLLGGRRTSSSTCYARHVGRSERDRHTSSRTSSASEMRRRAGGKIEHVPCRYQSHRPALQGHVCRAFRFEVKLNTNARRHANTAHEVSCVRVWTFFVNLNAVLASQALGRVCSTTFCR